MQLCTPLKWLQRHREFHAGAERPTEALPPEHACWMPVPKSWRELGIDEDEVPESTMASEVGQLPVDGGDFLPFLMEYRMIVEGSAEALRALGSPVAQAKSVVEIQACVSLTQGHAKFSGVTACCLVNRGQAPRQRGSQLKVLTARLS
jgi:hypothetical protein